jgi:putative ABC transport system permease protein
MVTLPRDLRLAVRTLLRKPGVTALAIASLSLAIGFSTAAFSVLDAYYLRDLPVQDPNALVRPSVTTREGRLSPVSWIEYQALTSRVRAFSGLAVEDREGQRVRLPGRDDYPIIGYVSDNYFDVLGVKAALGDVFHSGKGQDQTLVITHRYWQEMLGGKPDIVGSTLPVGRAILRIAAVLPPEFTGPNRGLVVDLFLPQQTFFGSLRALTPDDQRYTAFQLIGRLRPGATAEQARSEGEAVLRSVEADGLAPAPERKMAVQPFGEGSLSKKLESNAVMLGIIVLLVAIAATNLANLRLVENESRRHETGVRLALGAGRADLARIHLAETLLLSGAATVLGLGLAKWLVGLAPAIFYGGRRFTDFGIRLDGRAFLFSSAALVAVALLGAAIPLADAWRRRIGPALHGARTTRSSRWLSVLIVTQMAIVTGVVCSAALLWRSVDKLSQVRPQMDPDRRLLLVTGSFDAPGAQALPRIETVAEQVARVPGVERVAWARRAMLSGSGGGAVVEVEVAGQPRQQIYFNNVSASYFATTGARVVGGRAFHTGDAANATPVVMVNPTFTRRLLNGEDPVGQWIKVAGVDRQIVGVVEDGPHNSLFEVIRPYLYFPFAQRPLSYLTWFVETKRDPAGLAAAVRGAMTSADSSQTLFGVQTLREHMRNSRRGQELAAQVSGALASVGLLLAAAGLFGVTLFAVTRRTPEFGVRVAMGASPGRLLRQVLREAGLRVAIAVPLGWLIAYAGRRAIEKMLYGVAPDDPWTFAIATSVVALVAFAAALQPALRASRIDPMTALRHE